MLHPLIGALILLLNQQIYNSLFYEQSKPKYVRYSAAAANIIIYFYSDNTYLNELFKTGGGVV